MTSSLILFILPVLYFSPGLAHFKLGKALLRYLVKNQTLGLFYKFGSDVSEPINIAIYSDADFAASKDDRKSITGYVVLFNDTPISWVSQKQSTVACATMDSEFIAAFEGVREGMYFYHLLNELNLKVNKPMIVFIDNRATIQVCQNDSRKIFSKHMDVKYHYVKEQIDMKHVVARYVKSEDNLADIFTKILNAKLFSNIRDRLMKDSVILNSLDKET
jgi:cell fate (sporulation/competence/biofilm development) regulator YlbF (YheA/YmcA/DUF963 family)